MEQKAVVITFDPRVSRDEIHKILEEIARKRDANGELIVDWVGTPDTINTKHGNPVPYVP